MYEWLDADVKAAAVELVGAFQIHRLAAMSVPASDITDILTYPGEQDFRMNQIFLALNVLSTCYGGKTIPLDEMHNIAAETDLPEDIASHPISIRDLSEGTKQQIQTALMGGE